MKNKRYIIIARIFTIIFIFNVNTYTYANYVNNNIAESSKTWIETRIENKKIKKTIKKKSKEIKENKKIIKTQIKQRKRYHQNLVSLYNSNFDNNYLSQIENNSLAINYLYKELEKLKNTNTKV